MLWLFVLFLILALTGMVYLGAFLRVRYLKTRTRREERPISFQMQRTPPAWYDFALVAMFWAIFWGGMSGTVSFFMGSSWEQIIIMASSLFLVGSGQYLLFYLDLQSNPKDDVESFVLIFIGVCAAVASFVTIGIIASLLLESFRFFTMYPLWDFLTGTHWSPQQAALQADSRSFGFIPLIVGSLMITFIAMVIAIPVGLWSAVYLTEYASPRVRAVLKPVLEVLAGIPSVVFGFFAALSIAPFMQKIGELVGVSVASESALAAGVVIGMMIVPYISSLSDDVMSALPDSLRDGSYALGATKAETILRVLIPAAWPGILSSFLLAFSRAIGETMVVVMAAGLAAKMTLNPLEAMTTVTVQITSLLVGDQEFNSPKTLSAFALGIVLFLLTFAFNLVASRVIYLYRKRYEAL